MAAVGTATRMPRRRRPRRHAGGRAPRAAASSQLHRRSCTTEDGRRAPRRRRASPSCGGAAAPTACGTGTPDWQGARIQRLLATSGSKLQHGACEPAPPTARLDAHGRAACAGQSGGQDAAREQAPALQRLDGPCRGVRCGLLGRAARRQLRAPLEGVHCLTALGLASRRSSPKYLKQVPALERDVLQTRAKLYNGSSASKWSRPFHLSKSMRRPAKSGARCLVSRGRISSAHE